MKHLTKITLNKEQIKAAKNLKGELIATGEWLIGWNLGFVQGYRFSSAKGFIPREAVKKAKNSLVVFPNSGCLVDNVFEKFPEYTDKVDQFVYPKEFETGVWFSPELIADLENMVEVGISMKNDTEFVEKYAKLFLDRGNCYVTNAFYINMVESPEVIPMSIQFEFVKGLPQTGAYLAKGGYLHPDSVVFYNENSFVEMISGGVEHPLAVVKGLLQVTDTLFECEKLRLVNNLTNFLNLVPEKKEKMRVHCLLNIHTLKVSEVDDTNYEKGKSNYENYGEGNIRIKPYQWLKVLTLILDDTLKVELNKLGAYILNNNTLIMNII